MAKNNKMPAIRFSGYTDTWEQREFSDIFSEVKSGLSRMLSNDDIGLPVVRANNINDGQLNLVDDIKYWYKNDPQGANTNNYLIEQGDILINFINSEAKMGTAAYVTRRPERDTIYTTNILRCKVNDEYNPYFIYSLTFLNSYKNYIASITKPAVNQASFTTVDFKKYSIKIPTVKEQNQIADLIETFNKLITLHQRKLEKLKLTKKALLQKLFPQNGSKFPELRFKGFTAAWEQCKLSDITEIVMGQSPSSKNYTDNPNDNILVQGNADLKDGKVVPRLWTKEITKTIDKDGIVLTVRAPVGDVAKTDYKVVLGRGVAGIKGNDYIYQFLQKLQNNRYWVSLSSGSTFESINSNDIKDLIIDIPSIEEQTKISMLLNNVNSIITLHQRKLEMLKNVKKGLLQKMFV